ncbi:hypothetical protein ACU8KH_02594 [Lachancea thermotolerans]
MVTFSSSYKLLGFLLNILARAYQVFVLRKRILAFSQLVIARELEVRLNSVREILMEMDRAYVTDNYKQVIGELFYDFWQQSKIIVCLEKALCLYPRHHSSGAWTEDPESALLFPG